MESQLRQVVIMGVEQVRRHHHNYAHRHGARHGTAYISVNTRLCQACWKCVAVSGVF
ncbi:hypothetical protein [Pelotomaculum sp. FP]|uniref:hypothetical protein n=1 Tax=Pelotomaculum sp. FP TaxID=261474 RepID=UPI001FAAE68D|nr:hypothetical protein [Pelotomaculum sp. FP]